MTSDDLLKRIDELLEMANQLSQTKIARRTSSVTSMVFVDHGLFRGFRSATLSFLSQVFGTTHSYYVEFNAATPKAYFHCLSAGEHILKAARKEIADGWLFTVKNLVSAEIFADFIDMAEYLLSEGYKDAAAVMIGSVLEEHLRQLCQKHNIPVKRERGNKVVAIKADTLNADLAKADVYNKLEMKSVLAWLDLRNKAAHGKYDDYDKKQVELMLQGVMDFISRVSI